VKDVFAPLDVDESFAQSVEAKAIDLADSGEVESDPGELGIAEKADCPEYRGPVKIAIPGCSARFNGRDAREPLKPGDGDS
jgi:hypothetical protein